MNTIVSGSDKGNAGQDSISLDDIVSDAIDGAFDNSETTPEAVATAIPETTTEASAEPASKANETEESVSDATGIPETEPVKATNADFKAPSNWKADRQQVFNKLPRNVRKTVLDQFKDLERGMTSQGEKFAQQKKFAEEIDTALKPVEPLLQRTGTTKAAMVQTLASIYGSFVQKPAETIKWLAAQANLKPEQLFAPSQQATPAQAQQGKGWVDPAILALQQQFQTVVQRNQQYETELRKAQLTQQADEFVKAIPTAKDDKGQLRYPLVTQLAKEIEDVLNTNPAVAQLKTIQDRFDTAYRIAVGQNHEKLVQAQLQQAQAQSKSRASPFRPAPGTPSSNMSKKNASLDDIVSDAINKVGFA